MSSWRKWLTTNKSFQTVWKIIKQRVSSLEVNKIKTRLNVFKMNNCFIRLKYLRDFRKLFFYFSDFFGYFEKFFVASSWSLNHKLTLFLFLLHKLIIFDEFWETSVKIVHDFNLKDFSFRNYVILIRLLLITHLILFLDILGSYNMCYIFLEIFLKVWGRCVKSNNRQCIMWWIE